MSDDHWLDKALAEMESFKPDAAYNVVGVDRFAMAGEALYLIEHFDAEVEAEACRAEHEARTGNTAHVYGPTSVPEPARDG